MEPRDAATVILVRDGGDGPEVLLLRRRDDSGFVPGAWVFPGGAVDDDDSDPALVEYCIDLDDAHASELLDLTSGGLSFWAAGIRETFEEAGIFLGDPDVVVPASSARADLAEGRVTLLEVCRPAELALRTDEMRYFARWITPLGSPRRYDTRFFVAPMPHGQTAAADERETVAHRWITPRAALATHAKGNLELILPTFRSLELLADFDSVAALLAAIDRVHSLGTPPPMVDEHAGWRLDLDAAAPKPTGGRR